MHTLSKPGCLSHPIQSPRTKKISTILVSAPSTSQIIVFNLIDIQTNEIGFEAKVGGKISTYAMFTQFTQLLHYVQDNLTKGLHLPLFLYVIDSEKASIMKTADALPLLHKKTINRGKSASVVTQNALDQVSAYIGTYVISFKIAIHENEFISTVKQTIASGDIIRTQITPDNLK